FSWSSGNRAKAYLAKTIRSDGLNTQQRYRTRAQRRKVVFDSIDNLQECFEQLWIERTRLFAAHHLQRLLAAKARAMGAVCCHCLIAIDDREYPGAERNFLALETARVSCAVELFVMVFDNRNDFVRELNVA